MRRSWIKFCNLFRPRARKVNPYLSRDVARRLEQRS